MFKGILAGLVAGAIVTACVLKAMAARGPEPAATGGAPASAAATDVATMKKELEGLKSDGEALQKKIDASKAELASIEKSAASVKTGKKKRALKTWKDIAPLMAKAFGMRGQDDQGVDEETKKKLQMVELDLMGILAKIAEARGISVEEAMSAPEGLPALLRAILESGTPPGTPEQMAKMDALVAKYTEDWEKLRKNDEGTKLERRLLQTDLTHSFSDAFADVQTEEQRAAAGRGMGDMFGDGMGRDNQWYNGTKETVAEGITKHWGDSLKLTESQRGQLGPYVEDFMRQHDEIQKKQQELGEKFDWRAAQLAQARLQVEMQKALAKGLTLTPEQQKAMHDWGSTYDYWIQNQKVVEPQTDGPQDVPVPEESK